MAAVLVVDDEPDILLLAQLILEGEGHDVVAVLSGTSAIDELDARPFDVVLLDLRMPQIDGRRVLQHLRERGRLDDTAVIAFSAHASIATAEEVRGLGCRGYVAKPFTRADLVAAIDAALTEA